MAELSGHLDYCLIRLTLKHIISVIRMYWYNEQYQCKCIKMTSFGLLFGSKSTLMVRNCIVASRLQSVSKSPKPLSRWCFNLANYVPGIAEIMSPRNIDPNSNIIWHLSISFRSNIFYLILFACLFYIKAMRSWLIGMDMKAVNEYHPTSTFDTRIEIDCFYFMILTKKILLFNS